MGNEQSSEMSPNGEHSTDSPSPSHSSLAEDHASLPPSTMSPHFSTSRPSAKEGQRRTSKRIKRWSLCRCSARHTSRQACEADPKSSWYTGELIDSSPKSSISRDGPEATDDSQLEFKRRASLAPSSSSSPLLNNNTKSDSIATSSPSPSINTNLKSNTDSKPSDMSQKQSSTSGSKVPTKRPAATPAQKRGRAKKTKFEREMEEQGCECGDGHDSLVECERENMKEREDNMLE